MMITSTEERPDTARSAGDAPTLAPGGRRVPWIAAAGLLLLHAAVAWFSRAPGIVTYEDDAMYVALARSLRQYSYVELWRVGEPIHAMYPPGFPILLAAWSALGGEGYDWLAALEVASSVGALALTFAVMMRVGSPGVALIALASLAVNPYLIERAGNVMAEAPFMFLTMVALAALVAERPSRRGVIVAGVAAIWAALVRSAGLPLLAAVAIHLGSMRRYRALAVFGIAAAATKGSWLVWTVVAPRLAPGRSYIVDAASLAGELESRSAWAVVYEQTVEKFFLYVADLIPYRLPLPAIAGTPVDNALAALLSAGAIAVGLVVLLRRWRVAGLYLLFYIGLLMAWRWSLGRLIVPLLPVLVPAVLVGFHATVRRFRPAAAGPAVAALGAIMALTGAVRSADLVSQRADCPRGAAPPSGACLTPVHSAYMRAVEHVTRELPADAVVLSGRPAAVYYYSGRRAVIPEMVARTDPAALPDILRDHGAEYVLLGRVHYSEREILAPRVEASCEAFVVEARFEPRTYLLRLRGHSDPTELQGESACEAIARYRARPGDGATS